MSAVITSLGILSPLGVGREAFTAAWASGASAERVEVGPEASAVRLGKFRLRGLFPEHKSLARRIDRLSKMMAMAAALLRDEPAGLGERSGMGLAFGTDLGTLEETWKFLVRLRDKGPALANPADFPNLVPNAGPGYVGIFLGLDGPSHTFCQHGGCGDEALDWIADAVVNGDLEAGVAGGAEELGEIRVLASERAGCEAGEGAVPGEGATTLLIETDQRAEARGIAPLARWVGAWAACSPTSSPLGWELDSTALQSLIETALSAAGRRPDEVGVILASHPSDVPLRRAVGDALPGSSVPWTDHHARVGVHPADGAFRAALASVLLADPELSVNAAGRRRAGPLALLVSAARGASLRVTLLEEPT